MWKIRKFETYVATKKAASHEMEKWEREFMEEMKDHMMEGNIEEESGETVDVEKEQNLKKMFVLFLKFKAHMKKQKAIEEMKARREVSFAFLLIVQYLDYFFPLPSMDS